MAFRPLEVGDVATDSAKGPGIVTFVSPSGLHHVNGVEVWWLDRDDGAVFDRFYKRGKHLDMRAAAQPPALPPRPVEQVEQVEQPAEPQHWKFIEFNTTRAARGAPAAKVEVDPDGEWLWMTPLDIRLNIRDHGDHLELRKALAAYRGMA